MSLEAATKLGLYEFLRRIGADRPYRTFDLAQDGRRCAVVQYAEGRRSPSASVTALLNFFDELRRRVPTGGE
jgi:hypothetical protein